MAEQKILPGPKILEIGESGTGKSFSLVSMIDWAKAHGNRRVIALYTENSIETVLREYQRRKEPLPDNFFYHVASVAPVPFAALLDASKKVGMLSYEALTKLQDANRATNNPYEKILTIMSDFKDDRTGASLGNISTWTADDIYVIDSLSELANACMKMVVGNKPTASPSDYGVAQNNLLNLLRFLTQGFAPTLIMTAHVQRQTDEVSGQTKLMTKAIGKAMGDDIPQLFSEVIGCVKEGVNFWWDTAHPMLATKTRYLPLASKIKPDFAQIMDQWLMSRGT